MRQYHYLLQLILADVAEKHDRTGTVNNEKKK
jgi:hypothetical protein